MLCIHMDPSLLDDSSLTEQIDPDVCCEDMNPVVLGGEAKTAITSTTTMHVQLRAQFYVYGVYYDKEEVKIYAYFPYYRHRSVLGLLQ